MNFGRTAQEKKKRNRIFRQRHGQGFAHKMQCRMREVRGKKGEMEPTREGVLGPGLQGKTIDVLLVL